MCLGALLRCQGHLRWLAHSCQSQLLAPARTVQQIRTHWLARLYKLAWPRVEACASAPALS